jgi:DNA-directed RNA polymerase specialized sigma24 family protein
MCGHYAVYCRLLQQPAGKKMTNKALPEIPIDSLRFRALDGDPIAEARLFEDLRVRFTDITKRRVQSDNIEDIVQDALKIVFTKYASLEKERGMLVWSLTILRNVIGNFYQSRQRFDDKNVQVDNWQAVSEAAVDPSAMETEETTSLLFDAMTELSEKYPTCGTIFSCILNSHEKGGGQREISQRALDAVQEMIPDFKRGSFYTALHRCRTHLRKILSTLEEGASHA